MIQSLSIRLQEEANAAWGHSANKGEYLLYIVGRTVNIFCKAVKDTNLLKKFATGISLSAEWLRHFDIPVSPSLSIVTKHMMTVKGVIGAAEAFYKWGDIGTPLRDRTIVALSNSAQAAEASMWEKAAKKTSQVFDWILSVHDLATYALNSGLISVAKESVPTIKYGLSAVQVIAGFSMSGFGIWEESVKLTTGNIVRADTTVKGPGDGLIWKATFEDQVHSWIKMAMNVAYLVLAVYGLATLAGVILPAAATVKLVCLSVATAAALLNHLWKEIAIDSLNRAKQPLIAS